MANRLGFPTLFRRGIGITSQSFPKRYASSMPPSSRGGSQTLMYGKQPRQKKMNLDAMRDEKAEMQAARERNDWGLMQDTFIMPTGDKCPKILSKDYFTLLKHRVTQHSKDWAVLMTIKWYNIKPRPVFNLRQTKPKAVELHRQMYEAFAAGDSNKIKEICCEGLTSTLLARMQNRKKSEKVIWEIVEDGGAKVVSHRGAGLPAQMIGENSYLRQAVVRIKSVQRLTRYDKNGVVPGTGQAKSVEELFVIQKKVLGPSPSEEDSPWMIWGTTKETTIESMEQEKAAQKAEFGL